MNRLAYLLLAGILAPLSQGAFAQTYEVFDQNLKLKSRIEYDRISILGDAVRISSANNEIRLLSKDYKPFSIILQEFYEHYQKPVFIAETGIEDDTRPEWFRYICSEVLRALKAGVPIYGICLYPILNHPGCSASLHIVILQSGKMDIHKCTRCRSFGMRAPRGRLPLAEGGRESRRHAFVELPFLCLLLDNGARYD